MDGPTSKFDMEQSALLPQVQDVMSTPTRKKLPFALAIVGLVATLGVCMMYSNRANKISRMRSTNVQILAEESAALCGDMADPDVCASLSAMYNGMSGDGWVMNKYWVGGYHYCYWQGISCDDDWKVVEIELHNMAHLGGNNMVGEVPDVFEPLTELVNLDFGYSPDLRGSVPNSISTLQKLQFLRISHSGFDGDITDFYFPPNLAEIKFAFNRFTGSVPDLTHLSKLQHVSFVGNSQLGGQIPAEICARVTEVQSGGTNIVDACSACVGQKEMSCDTYRNFHSCRECGSSGHMARCDWDEVQALCVEKPNPTCDCEALDDDDCSYAWWCKLQRKLGYCHVESEVGTCGPDGWFY